MSEEHMKVLNQLRRLPENKECATCNHTDRMGYKDVCMKFKTFVCSDCKSAHQAFSHRCKSVTMSNWTMMEVQALDEKNNGGNRAAVRQWLANAPESMRPSP